MFQIVRVDRRQAEEMEWLGTKSKFWYREDADGPRMLFKAEERGTGEDWAEKVACELAASLGLPHVHYELAREVVDDLPGVVCESCAPRPISLELGNQLLLARDPEYPAGEGRKYKVREHTVAAVAEVVGTLAMPPAPWSDGLPDGVDSALGVFAGYVLLDAWVANQDRHHENWAALRVGRKLHLAPTFDHGASLARNVPDKEKHDRLTTRDRNRTVGHFVRRARSAFYAVADQSKPMTTLEAWMAFAERVPQAARAWLDRLAGVQPGQIEHLLEAVPPDRISGISRRFTIELLLENQQRLLGDDV